MKSPAGPVKLEWEEHSNQTMLSFEMRCGVALFNVLMSLAVVLVFLTLLDESLKFDGILDERHVVHPPGMHRRAAVCRKIN